MQQPTFDKDIVGEGKKGARGVSQRHCGERNVYIGSRSKLDHTSHNKDCFDDPHDQMSTSDSSDTFVIGPRKRAQKVLILMLNSMIH
jgi:hypothetical protein